jgi:hypothetical protein
MKRVKSREEYLAENIVDFDTLHEDAEVDIDVMLDDESEDVVKTLDDIGVTDKKVLPFGVIKVKAKKKNIADIKNIKGVESVEVIK